ncbi:hypothetical protein WR25_22156 [Diploscapter pachys]|uniref:C-type lectin domain-containing protein n=1 Tax=Diploscapter pachys TaxID=2018661 RepID=A0A2A2KYP9_9BILA|nr:hypothetical protein WR25_22156 [Diploscapter pachys]
MTHQSFYIGLYSPSRQVTNWVYTDGSAYDFTNWMQGEPSVARWNGGLRLSDGKWLTVSNSASMAFACSGVPGTTATTTKRPTTHSMNNWNKGPDNCKSVPDPNQIYMVNTFMGPNHKTGETRFRLKKWAGLGADPCSKNEAPLAECDVYNYCHLEHSKCELQGIMPNVPPTKTLQ